METARFIKVIGISAVMLLTSSALLFGKTDVLFSPRGEINGTIIRSINSSEDSIDIAVFIFTAGDIAEALLTAKERGVKIRIVIDEKQGKKRHPILDFLREEGFDLLYLKGTVGGFMHNTFAIFDGKLVITGSYNWTEYAEKFNYENVLLIDEPDVITRFQKEFENLFEKGIKGGDTANRTNTNQIKSDPAKEEIKRPELYVEGETVKSPVESPENLLNISFEEFDVLFGAKSKMEDSEKKELWKNKFKDKYVKWNGMVCYKGISLYDWNKIGISHKKKEGADVQIMFDWTKKEKVRRLEIGEIITYTGKLASLRGLTSPYKLIDCNIE